MKKAWIGTTTALVFSIAIVHLLVLDGSLAAGQNPGKLSASISIPGESAAGVVVRLEGVPGSNPRLKGVKKDAKMGQRDLQFDPTVVAVPAGSSIDFPNHDKVFHNVFSLSRTKRFDLGLYKQGSSKTVTFNRPGVVDVYCNIHPQMVAKILVVDTVHYAVTNAQGVANLDGVPPGTYPVVAWHPQRGEVRGEATVAPGQTAQIKLTLSGDKQSTRHLRKDGTPYGRYK